MPNNQLIIPNNKQLIIPAGNLANIISAVSSYVMSKGAATKHGPTTSGFIRVCVMDSTHVIVLYNYTISVYAVCLTLSGTTITNVGTPAPIFDSAEGYPCGLCTMNSTHAIACYTTGTDYEAKCLTLSGTNITPGSAVTLHSYNNPGIDIVSLDSTYAISWSGDKITCLSLSDTTITKGTPISLGDSAYPDRGASICRMDSTHAMAVVLGVAYCITRTTGTTITLGSGHGYATNVVEGISIASFSTTKAVVTYKNSSDDAYVKVLDLSGTVITSPGSSVLVFNLGLQDARASSCCMNDTFSFCFFNDANLTYPALVKRNGNELTVEDTDTVFTNYDKIDTAVINNSSALVSYLASGGGYSVIYSFSAQY